MNNLKKRKGILFLLVALIAISSLLISAKVLANGGEWPQFHNDAANTGYTTSEAPDTAYLKWVSDDIGAVSSSSPVLANGKVFINTGDSLTCLNESTGAVLWSENINASSVWGSWLSPAYDNGRVFISGAKVYCFSENGGPAEWTFDLPSNACNGGPTVADGKVFAGDWDGHHYYCLNGNSGAQKWVFTVSGYAQGTPAYADGKVYLTSYKYVGGNVYCVNANTGQEIWHTFWDDEDLKPMDWDTCGSPCVADGKVFVTTYNFSGYGELAAMDAYNGTILWKQTIQRSDSTPAYHDGKVYVCGGCVGYSDLQTYCFDASTGALLWQTPVTLGVGDWTCSVAVADGKVFVGKPDSANFFDYIGIYALDITDGSEIWHYDHGGASPAVANGKVFTIGEGKVWAFGSITYPDWDVNQDGQINILDVARVGLHWGETGEAGWIREDVNKDGNIDILDVAVIGLHWGE